MTEDYDVDALTRRFKTLGASNPRKWAESQVNEGNSQLARFLFLREAWRRIISEDDLTWIDREIASAQDAPGAPYAGIGHALRRIRGLGAADADLTDLVRGMQANLLFSLCYLLEDPNLEEPEAAGVYWALAEVNEDDEFTGFIEGLHESVLETDPTGREMRPRPR